MPVLPWSAQVICYSCWSLGLRDKYKVCPLDLSTSPFQSLFSLQHILTKLVTIFPLIHESPPKARKAHPKCNQKNPALYNDMSGFSERLFSPGLEDWSNIKLLSCWPVKETQQQKICSWNSANNPTDKEQIPVLTWPPWLHWLSHYYSWSRNLPYF